MGQYFLVVNTDKKEYLMPHNFGSGLKFMEFTVDGCGVMHGLAHLLAQSSDGVAIDAPEITGRWIGDNVVIVGDYDESKLFDLAQDCYENISNKVICHMAEDRYVRDTLVLRRRWDGTNNTLVHDHALRPDVGV